MACHWPHSTGTKQSLEGRTLLMFSFQETDFLMSSQCHLLVNFKSTNAVVTTIRKEKQNKRDRGPSVTC